MRAGRARRNRMKVVSQRFSGIPTERTTAGGFTLIELLSVVVVVTILLALLFGASRSVVARVNSAKCLGQLRALSAAASSYAAENNGRVLPGDGWVNRLQELGITIPRCPAYLKLPDIPEKAKTGLYTGYGRSLFWGASSGFAGSGAMDNNVAVGTIPNPAKTVDFYDNDSWNGGDAYGGYVTDDATNTWYYKLYSAHGNSFNVSFCDGHAESITFNPEGPADGSAAGGYRNLIWKPHGPKLY